LSSQSSERYAVIVADNFGRSSSVNVAVAEAYDRGVLSAASIMAGGKAFEEAAQIARKRSGLSVGLHVTLSDGRGVLPHSEVPGLVDMQGCFEKNPSRAWIRYSKPGILKQIDAEINAQFSCLEKAGVRPDYIDSHQHLHMHPALFSMVCRHASRRGIRWVRIPHEPLSWIFQSRNVARGVEPYIEWLAYSVFRIFNLAKVRTHGLLALPYGYGLSQEGQIDEQYLLDILTRPGHIIEIDSQPDIATETGRKVLGALMSSEVRSMLTSRGMAVVGYQDLTEEIMLLDTGVAKGL
jgi:chitin disaccharide deacetylase